MNARYEASILLTDMVGYTTLTRNDGPLALDLLEQSRKLIRAQLARHRGREIKTIGDAVLAEFSDTADAVRCAVSIQQALAARNARLPPAQSIVLRIGVHRGEVVHQDGDIYGDAVNVVSRVEPLARPGQVCLTDKAWEAVEGSIPWTPEPLGLRSLRGLPEPVELYEITCSEGQPPRRGLEEGADSHPVIAVLPLLNLSADPENEFFSDGMTEELIAALSQMKGLRVISRTSAFSLKGKHIGIREIGELLGADAVLEGSVRRSESRVRITAQLIDAQDDTHLWARSFDRELMDVFGIQEEIARAIAQALEVELLDRPARQRATGGENLEAYTLYLKGRFCWNQRTQMGLKRAIVYFERAIQADPDYALAYSGLADAFTVLPDYSTFPADEAYRRARAAATRALELDEHLAEAHASLADVKLLYEWDWRAAEEGLQQAIRLSPGYATAYHWYGHCLLYTGRFEEASVWLEQALQMDPLSVVAHSTLGIAYYAAGDHQRALAALRRAFEIDPKFAIAEVYLGLSQLALGHFAEALETFGRARAHMEDNTALADAGIALAHALAGEDAQARELLENLRVRAESSAVSPFWIAVVYAGLGEADEAFRWLDHAYRERDSMLRFLLVVRVFDPLRSDARYPELVGKLWGQIPDLAV